MPGLIAQNISQIRANIPEYIRLIAVTKTVSPLAMREAYEAGIRDFAENRLQEALSKRQELQDLTDVTWHFIGHIQTNKARKVIENFAWIHSVDSLKLAKRLNKLARELDCQPQVCLQVKLRKDPNKYGWEVPELWQDLPQIALCDFLNIQGLMSILPLGLSETEILATFKAVKQLAREINHKQYPSIQMNQLSMGMSGDYLLAIEAGATMIRLGQIIFGARKN
ncbi:MAG: YggS family pyridoxal phosphate-dependent enzyme [Xenococcaceae cyanobacterium]